MGVIQLLFFFNRPRKGNFSFANPLKIMPSLSPSRFSLPLILTWHRFAAYLLMQQILNLMEKLMYAKALTNGVVVLNFLKLVLGGLREEA